MLLKWVKALCRFGTETKFTLSLLKMTQGFVDGVDQDQAARNMHCPHFAS